MANRTKFGAEAREALLAGIKTVHDAVAMSLGARGRNAVFRQYGRPKITNDGVRIGRNIDPVDEFEKLGADLIKEASEQTDHEAGDGTTTSTVLAYALIEEGMKELADGASPMVLREMIDKDVEYVVEKLEKEAVKIEDLEALEHIAMVSVENEKLGKTIAKASHRAGVYGAVVVEEHDKPVIELEQIDGYRFQGQLLSPYFVTNPERMEAILEDVPVLVTEKDWNLNADLVPLIERLHQAGNKSALIVVEDISGELLQTLVTNHLKGIFHAIVVKKPFSTELLEDVALVTGATAMTKEKGINEPHMSYLGHANKVIANRYSTTIIGGGGDKDAVSKRADELKELILTLDNYEKTKAQERLAKLTGGVSIIRIGAPTAAERGYLKLKADDAVNACKAALEDGIVPGGGVALKDISMGMEEPGIVKTAILKPYLLITASMGLTTVPMVKGAGFDVKTRNMHKSMIEAGIIDPLKVTRSALKNAASLAGVFLTTEVAVAEIPEARTNEAGYR